MEDMKNARELQIIKLSAQTPDEIEFEFTVRAPGVFACAFPFIDQVAVVGPNGPQFRVTPALAFDSSGGGEPVSYRVAVVAFGRAFNPKPGFRVRLLSTFIDPGNMMPVAIYKIEKTADRGAFSIV